MKQITGAAVLALAVFSLFFFSETASADKADYGFSMPSNYVFVINSMDGASAVRIEVSPYPGDGSYVFISSMGSITQAGTYEASAILMYKQFGPGDFQCRVTDLGQLNHFSQSIRFTIPN